MTRLLGLVTWLGAAQALSLTAALCLGSLLLLSLQGSEFDKLLSLPSLASDARDALEK